MGVSVRGALMNWSDKELAALLIRDDGTKPSASEAKAFLLDELAKGHERLPMGECDNWDWKRGCLGHEQSENKP